MSIQVLGVHHLPFIFNAEHELEVYVSNPQDSSRFMVETNLQLERHCISVTAAPLSSPDLLTLHITSPPKVRCTSANMSAFIIPRDVAELGGRWDVDSEAE